ncbi:MAG: dihydroxyacetone kinase subunit DhaK [Treponema sp.]|jgi:dihydroxyacetone kinase|nr:dihydroxyacetone kinase subunit DhaK [Treponema sp.]
MKKILNSAENMVSEMGAALALANTAVIFDSRYRYLRKKTINRNKVSLLSGGGSGHEPAHGGFVGAGMLDAAICGDVFASPSQIQVYRAITGSAGDRGSLLIIKNYSGDVMNFQNAAYLAEMDGLAVDYVKVCDDIAVQDSLYTVGRRGVAGTVLVHKIAGAAAEAGGDLAEVKRLAQKTADHVRSLGFALSSCTVPAKGTPTFSLDEGEMEYGIGIHGEPGIRREKLLRAGDLAKRIIPAIGADLKLKGGDEVALLVNGFGATPLMELHILAYSLMPELIAGGLKVYRIFTGNYMTSLDMAGASVSLLKLDGELKTLLDAPSDAPGFMVRGAAEPPCFRPIPCPENDRPVSYRAESGTASLGNGKITLENMIYIIDKMSELIIENEKPFCEIDAHGGDGDFGMSVAKGFRRLKFEWEIPAKSKTIGELLDACSIVIMEHCGGASGPLWGFAFKYAAKNTAGKTELDIPAFAAMMGAAVQGIQETGKRCFGRGAEVGDKTLIDALSPCADTWLAAAKKGGSPLSVFREAAAAAVAGAESTRHIVARMGRAENAGKRSLGYADAGAYALGFIFTKIAESLSD